MIQRRPSRFGVRIVNQRQFGIRQQREPARAGGRTIAPKGLERSDHKGRRGDQGNAQDAAAGPVLNAAQAQRDQPADGSKPARVEPGRLEQQSGDQQQRARAEETGGLVQFAESAAPTSAAARRAAARSREPSPPRRPALPLTRQQAAGGNGAQAAQGPRHGTEARDHAGSGPDGQRWNGGVQGKQPGPHGVEPPGAQPQQDERAVCQRRRRRRPRRRQTRAPRLRAGTGCGSWMPKTRASAARRFRASAVRCRA